MIHVKDAEEIRGMRESNRIVGELLDYLGKRVAAGVSTLELDRLAEELIRDRGAIPAFKGYVVRGLPPFPGSICASVNSCIVHGIPSAKAMLKDGDIVGVDVGVLKNGFFGDGAFTYTVGEVSPEIVRLLGATREALRLGIAQARPGNRVGDISHAIESYLRSMNYYAADNLTGHGIGRELHEDPMIPNIGRKGVGARLQKGMTLAIEPMVNIGTHRVREIGWEFHVADGSLSAHYEHTVLVTDDEPEILTRVN
jgi:methionyl aminopeptidase